MYSLSESGCVKTVFYSPISTHAIFLLINTDPVDNDTTNWNTEIDVIEDYELFYGLDRWQLDD